MNNTYAFPKENKSTASLLVSITSKKLRIAVSYELGMRKPLICFCFFLLTECQCYLSRLLKEVQIYFLWSIYCFEQKLLCSSFKF